jgi:S-adenosylmethionine synthetase
MPESWIQTAESVTAGHADKICDQIADDILDAILREDRYARVACEVMATTGMVIVTGQITTKCYLDITGLVRATIRRVGYDDPATGFDHRSCSVLVMLEEQSGDVSLGVDRKGAGDQGVCVGYATDEGRSLPVDMHYMPVPALLANRLAHRLQDVRESGKVPSLYPDGKVQVSIRYRGETPEAISAVVVSAHHRADADLAQLRRDLKRHVIKPVLEPTGLLETATRVFINPVGAFREGGPRADSGLTGRKITVDCFGPACPHGGSALSGKDPTKPDRSGTYAARWVAKNLVAAGLARRCTVEIAYVIGMPEPLSVTVHTAGTGRLPDSELTRIVQAEFDLSPAGIIECLDLRRPVYGATAVYGHFGRDEEGFTWERLDRVDHLRRHLPTAAKAPAAARAKAPRRTTTGGA